MDTLASRGLNSKSHPNHTICGSFESSCALENGKNNEKYASKKVALGRHVVKI